LSTKIFSLIFISSPQKNLFKNYFSKQTLENKKSLFNLTHMTQVPLNQKYLLDSSTTFSSHNFATHSQKSVNKYIKIESISMLKLSISSTRGSTRLCIFGSAKERLASGHKKAIQ
jgi:hypothetical protein